LLVSVCISEDNFCKWRSSAWVVDNVLHNSLDVSVSLNVVKSSESSWRNSLGCVCCENKTTTVSLGYNETTMSLSFTVKAEVS
jgi:hypothetical protein